MLGIGFFDFVELWLACGLIGVFIGNLFGDCEGTDNVYMVTTGPTWFFAFLGASIGDLFRYWRR